MHQDSYSDADRARFWGKVTVGGPTECWPWKTGRHEFGYGWFWAQGRNRNAHRVAYELAVGPVPAGYFVCHSCDNPPCCNPAHLRAGTPADNQGDMAARGRSVKGRQVGSRHPGAKLTDADVIAIRAAVAGGTLQRVVAATFGITESSVSSIKTRSRWAHLR